MRISDWSSDVCSSDLRLKAVGGVAPTYCACRLRLLVAVDLGLQVVLLAEPRDQVELRFQPVDVLFLGLEDVGEQPAADEIAELLAVHDRGPERRERRQLQRQVALEDLLEIGRAPALLPDTNETIIFSLPLSTQKH